VLGAKGSVLGARAAVLGALDAVTVARRLEAPEGAWPALCRTLLVSKRDRASDAHTGSILLHLHRAASDSL